LQRSTDRILTTHTGSLPRPADLTAMLEALDTGAPLDGAAYQARVRRAVGEIVRKQLDAGIDVVSDGEQRRESYFNRFANALGGIDADRPGSAIARLGRPTPVPRVVGPIERVRPVSVAEATFLRAITGRRIKITVPGPFTLSSLAQDEHYRDPEALAMAYAAAVNAELRELEPIVDWLQLDEPYLQAHPDRGGPTAWPPSTAPWPACASRPASTSALATPTRTRWRVRRSPATTGS
jgi:methionine synthase II (cobalamin-independent)